eukprot:gene20635-22569_t
MAPPNMGTSVAVGASAPSAGPAVAAQIRNAERRATGAGGSPDRRGTGAVGSPERRATGVMGKAFGGKKLSAEGSAMLKSIRENKDK